jgi:hypothetical protein
MLYSLLSMHLTLQLCLLSETGKQENNATRQPLLPHRKHNTDPRHIVPWLPEAAIRNPQYEKE